MLNEIGRRCKVDKCDKYHDYLRYYERYFEKIRDEDFLLIEIGVYKGASMRLWREYFSRARIVGIDRKRYIDKVDGVSVEIGNCKDRVFVEDLLKRHGEPKVIIDDGSHKWCDTNYSLDYYLPKVVSGGFYCIEDLQCCYEPGRKKYGNSKMNPIDRLKGYVDVVNLYGTDSCGGGYRGKEERGKDMDFWEKLIEWIHFYNGLTIIGRR